MNHKYIVYPVYGKDKFNWYFRQQTIVGVGKEYNDAKSLWQAIANNELKFKSDNLLIVDWAHYRFKTIYNGFESTWHKFKASEFTQNYRWITPCEEWEVDSKGYIVGAIAV